MMDIKKAVLSQCVKKKDVYQMVLGRQSSGKSAQKKMKGADTLTDTVAQKKDIMRVLKNVSHLFTLPGHVISITHMLQSRHTNVDDLSREISRDPALAAEILKIVNSGFYGLDHVTSISHAVVVLGFNVIHALVLSSSVVNIRPMKLLWNHSVACANVCSILASKAGLPSREEISTVGLLHDIGKVVLMEYLSEEFESVHKFAKHENMLLYEAEQKLTGVTHAEIGRWLLELWHLPAEMVEPIGSHHALNLDSPYATRAAVVHLSDFLARAAGFHSNSIDIVPRLDPRSLELLGLTMADIRSVLAKIFDMSELRK